MTRDMEVVFVADKSLSELASLFECEIDDDDFYDVVAYNISQADPDYLLRHIDRYTGSQLRGAVFGLGLSPTRNRAQETRLVALLGHSDPLVIAETLDALRHADYRDYWSDVSPLIQHESPFVRGAVIRYARHVLVPEQAYSFLIAALGDAHAMVRSSAVDELGDLGAKEAVSHIRLLLRDPDDDVREAARTAINGLVRPRP